MSASDLYSIEVVEHVPSRYAFAEHNAYADMKNTLCAFRPRIVLPQLSLLTNLLGDAIAIGLLSYAMLRKFATGEEESCAAVVNERQVLRSACSAR